jgi:ketol-acid reductoisomerase
LKKTELLERVRAAHGEMERALEGLSEEDATRPGLNPNWSARDALSHVVAWEAEAADAIEGIRAGTYAPRTFDRESIDLFNEEAVAERRGRTFAEVRAEFDVAHRRLTGVLEALPEEVEERTPVYKFAEGAGFKHLSHHAAQIEEWKKRMTNAE